MRPGRFGGWIGAGLADAGGRLLILSAATAYLARALPPDAFGASALVLSAVTILSMFVGTPYEEALAQARVVRRADLAAILALSLGTAVALIAACVPVGRLLDAWYARDDLGLLLPGTAVLLIAQGPLVVATAVARRRRAFYAINAAGLLAHLAAAAVALALVRSGAGIWSIVALRVVVAFAGAAILSGLLGLAVLPRWDWGRVRRLNRFAGYVLAGRAVESATYLVYNAGVGALFGLTVLGYLNLAARLIEPVRGAILVVGHTLAFPHFRRAEARPGLGAGAARVAVETAALVAPAVLGLAAIGPVLVPLLAGPGWEAAAPIAAALAVGGVVMLPSQVIQTALSATGRPQLAFRANAAGLAVLVLVLAVLAGGEPGAIGLARLAGDAAQALVTVLVGGRLIGLPRAGLARGLGGVWLAAAVMAALVALLGTRLPGTLPPVAVLAVCVAAGAALYGPLLYLLARPSFRALRRRAAGARSGSA